MGYFKDTLRGISWMGGLRLTTRGLAILKTAVLARILLPSQFGIYGIALLILGLLEVLTETGINVFLIQEKDDTEKYLNSAWVVSILRGIVIALVILATVPLVIYFFNSPGVRNLLYLTALVAFVRGFINPMEVSFQKKLQFHKEFLFQASLFAVDAGGAIALGILTKHESSLIFGMLFAAVVEVILSFIVFKTRPKLQIEADKVKKVVARGKWITGAGFFSYLFQNIDNIIVGRFMGTAPLGLYQQAYRISTLPVTEVGQVFNKVTFPVYVAIGGDRKRLQKAFFRTLLVIFGLVLPFGLLIFFFSRPVILLLLGDKWLGAEPALKVLAIYGVLKSILNSSYSLFLSVKKQKIVMLAEMTGIFGIAIAVVPFVGKFGLIGAGYSAIIGAIFCLPIILINLRRVFNDRSTDSK